MSGGRAETKRAYYQSHKEQYKVYSRKYYLKNKSKYREYCRKWRMKNKEKIPVYQAKWYYGPSGRDYHARNADKLRKQQLRRWALDPEKYILMCREHAHSPKGKAYHAAYRKKNRARLRMLSREWDARNPEKIRAYYAVSKAIKNGIIFKSPCEKCGDIKSVAAHEDYSRPLDVTWLCRDHVAERNRRMPNMIERAKALARSI
jgi:hypothetical protein